jgi:hypothetical protein
MLPHSCFLAPIFPIFSSLTLNLPLPPKLCPPITAMASNLPCSHQQTEDDLRRLRRVLGWQSSGFDGWMWHSTLPLINLQLREFVFFTCYATAGLLPLVSSFLFTLLEFYGLELQHL